MPGTTIRPPRARVTTRPFVVAIEGPSGVGKSTVAVALARRLDALLIREAYDRLDPKPSLDVDGPETLLRLERRLLAEERRRFREAERARSTGRPVVLDTGYLGPLVYSGGLARTDSTLRPAVRELGREVVDALRDRRLAVPDRSIDLRVADAVLAERLGRSPRRHPERWRERHARIGPWERSAYRRAYDAASPTRWTTVDASRAVDAVVGRLERTAVRAPRSPTPRESSEIVLSLLRSALGTGPPGIARSRAVGNR